MKLKGDFTFWPQTVQTFADSIGQSIFYMAISWTIGESKTLGPFHILKGFSFISAVETEVPELKAMAAVMCMTAWRASVISGCLSQVYEKGWHTKKDGMTIDCIQLHLMLNCSIMESKVCLFFMTASCDWDTKPKLVQSSINYDEFPAQGIFTERGAIPE